MGWRNEGGFYDDHYSARNIDLPRKVTYKVRKSSIRPSVTDAEKEMVKSRNYEAFQKYMEENPYVPVVEMDTVVGPVHTHKLLLTLMFRNCSLLLAVLLPCKTQEYVIQALNDICDGIGIKNFQKMFPVILTDRRMEFYFPRSHWVWQVRRGQDKALLLRPAVLMTERDAWKEPWIYQVHSAERYSVWRVHAGGHHTDDKPHQQCLKGQYQRAHAILAVTISARLLHSWVFSSAGNPPGWGMPETVVIETE